mgnify:CR=1 FL=1
MFQTFGKYKSIISNIQRDIHFDVFSLRAKVVEFGEIAIKLGDFHSSSSLFIVNQTKQYCCHLKECCRI